MFIYREESGAMWCSLLNCLEHSVGSHSQLSVSVEFLACYITMCTLLGLCCYAISQGPPNLVPKDLDISQGLVAASGDTWKTGRQVLTPSFSGMKMKLVDSPILHVNEGWCVEQR